MAPALKKLRRTITETQVEKKRPSVKRSQTNFAAKVLQVVNPELKEWNTYNGGVPAAGGSVIGLNLIPQGADINNRNGRHLRTVGFQYTYQFLIPSGGALSDYITFWLVWDSNPNASTPALAGVLDTSGGVSIDMAMMNTGSNRDRFTLLRHHHSFIAAGTGSQSDKMTGKGYISLAKVGDTEYNGSATAIPNRGGLFMLTCTRNNTGVVATSASVLLNGRLTFRDS